MIQEAFIRAEASEPTDHFKLTRGFSDFRFPFEAPTKEHRTPLSWELAKLPVYHVNAVNFTGPSVWNQPDLVHARFGRSMYQPFTSS